MGIVIIRRTRNRSTTVTETTRQVGQFQYESWCDVHGASEHLHGQCVPCMPEWLRPRRESPKVTPANRIRGAAR